MYPHRIDYCLTIETRSCEIHPREVLLAFAAASRRDTYAIDAEETIEDDNWVSELAHGIDLSEFFPCAFIWAGNLHIGLPHEYLTFIRNRGVSEYRRFEDFLNVVMKTYPCVTRAVFVHFNDTSMTGNMVVYCMKKGRLTRVEKLKYGVGYDDGRINKNAERIFSRGRDAWSAPPIGEEPVDYIQGKYGLHTVDPNTHFSYRADLVDVEVLV